jgi:hypothetical protein
MSAGAALLELLWDVNALLVAAEGQLPAGNVETVRLLLLMARQKAGVVREELDDQLGTRDVPEPAIAKPAGTVGAGDPVGELFAEIAQLAWGVDDELTAHWEDNADLLPMQAVRVMGYLADVGAALAGRGGVRSGAEAWFTSCTGKRLGENRS